MDRDLEACGRQMTRKKCLGQCLAPLDTEETGVLCRSELTEPLGG